MRPFALVFLPLLIAYGVTLLWCFDRWNAPTLYFEHCWLVPWIGAIVLWQRRRQWRAVPAAPDMRGLRLLIPGLLLHLAASATTVDSLSAISLCLTVPGAAWLALGRARLAGQWPVLWLVLFIVPWPMYVDTGIAAQLKEVAVDGGSWLANVLGADIARTGAFLRPVGMTGELWVADACGGLRSLLAMSTIAYCLAFFVGPAAWPRRLMLMLVAGPVAVLANIVRIALLCLLARWFGVDFAEGTGHTLANIAEWTADVGILLLLDGWIGRRFGTAPASRPEGPAVPPLSARALRGPAIVLWLLAGPLLWLGVHRPHTDGEPRAELLPGSVAGYVLVPRSGAEQERFERSLPRWRELLGTGDFVWRRYRDEAGARISLVALFHDANWKSVHPPRICIAGSNMDIEIDDVVELPELGGSTGRIVARGRTDGRLYVTLSVFGTRGWSSGSYSDFVWYHLPLAMLRRGESGFLLRAESMVRNGEQIAAAERRCAAFLRDILPAARGLLR